MGSNKGPIAASGRLDAFLGIFVAIVAVGAVLGLVLWIGVGGNSPDQNLAADPLVETSVSDNESIIALPTTTANEIAVQTSTTKPTPSSAVTTTTAPMYPTECTDPIDAPLSDGLPLRSSIQEREFAYVAPEERQRVVVYARPNSDVQFVCAHVRHTSNSIQEQWQTEVLLEPNGTPWMATEGYVYWSFTFVPPVDAPIGEYEVFLTAVDSSGLVNSGRITSFDLIDPSENEGSTSEAATPSTTEAAKTSATCGPPTTWFEPHANGHHSDSVFYEEVDGVANFGFAFTWMTLLWWSGEWWNKAENTCKTSDGTYMGWHPDEADYPVWGPVDIGYPDFTVDEAWAEVGGSTCESTTYANNFRFITKEARCQISPLQFSQSMPSQTSTAATVDATIFVRISTGEIFSKALRVTVSRD